MPLSSMPVGVTSDGLRASPLASLRDLHERHRVDEAVRKHEVAVPGDGGVPHDVAAARDGPALEFFGLRVEAYDRIRGRPGLAVPDDVVDRRDAIGLGLR